MPSSRKPRSAPRATVVVLGSLNMDLVVRVPHLPKPGQTIAGSSFQSLPGGKGANQAVAIARLGGHAQLVGCVGRDDHGRQLRRNLRAEGVDGRHLRTHDVLPTGIALIQVGESHDTSRAGENSIVVIPAANHGLTPEDVLRIAPVIARAHLLLVQLEIPLDTAAAALRIAAEHGVFTVLDTAPVPQSGLPAEPFMGLDILSPNQTEAALLTGRKCRTRAECAVAAGILFRKYQPSLVVIKMGADGALAFAGPQFEPYHQPPFAVEAKDTTAAGDAFTAALALYLAEGRDLEKALRFAAAAGALATTKLGAQSAMPSRAAVQRLLRSSRPAKPAE